MKVIFMGTPHFAVPALKKLIESEHEVVAVYTKPPKEAGRGYQLQKSPIHELAELNNLKVYTPATFKLQENVDEFLAIDADIVVVAAYGLILRKVILEAKKHGCINIHPSKLPRWRGAAPIQHTILSGDKDTSVCIMQMDEGLDTGDIIAEKSFDIDFNMTAYQLHDKCAEIGGEMVLEVLESVQNGTIQPKMQSDVGVTYANKITKDDEKIDWSKSAFEINCKIRTLTPRPSAYFEYKGEKIKIIQADVIDKPSDASAGTVIDSEFTIATGNGFLRPTLLQREGRKMIYTDAFLRGFEIKIGDQLT